MKTLFSAFFLASFLLSATAVPAEAGTMSRACIKSDRKAKTRRLCSCMQSVADSKLSRREQARAAKFFKDPQLAQGIRQSDKSGDEKFWKRYKAFGKVFSASCKHLK